MNGGAGIAHKKNERQKQHACQQMGIQPRAWPRAKRTKEDKVWPECFDMNYQPRPDGHQQAEPQKGYNLHTGLIATRREK